MAAASTNPTPPPITKDSIPIGDPIIGWLTEAVAEGEAFLSAQPGYSQISRSIETIMSSDEGEPWDPRAGLSATRTNRVAKIAEDLSALMTDTKPFWDYSVANRRFEQHAQIYGKLATFWYQRRNIDLRLADVIKYYVAAGTGYLHLFWNPEIEDIDAHAEDPRNVLPIRPTNYDSLESCVGVIVKRKVPVNYIKDRYGITVSADSDGSSISWLDKVRDTTDAIISPIWKWHKSDSTDKELPRIPTVTLYTCYLKDPRKHDGSSPKYMGEWSSPDETGKRKELSNWSYIVQPGEALYPHRRMIVWVGGRVAYDGPSFYWHDQFPIIKLTPNPYPWSWLGKAPCWDLLRLQQSENKLLRVIDDHCAQVAEPGSIHDKNNVSRAQFDAFSTRRAGYKIFQNPMAGKGIQIITPPPLDNAVFEHLKWIENEMKELSGVVDASQLMRLNQMPSNSTVESILNSMTPALRFRSRILEAFQRVLAMQLAYNFSQFYTLPMRVTELGPGGVTQDDFDYDPGSLMPDYVHADDYWTPPGAEHQEIKSETLVRGPLPRYDRAREFLRQFVFKISPGSLLNAAQVEQKLIYLQLWRGGLMDPFTLWEQLGIGNTGVLPDNVRTIPERILYAQQIGLSGDVSPAGRKASGQQTPRIKMSESG